MNYPAFYDDAPRIAMCDPLAALLGAAEDGLMEYRYIDAVHLAGQGQQVTATDWSERMVERTRDRAREAGVPDRVEALAIGAHELQRLAGDAGFDGAYSNLGPLNCVPDLGAVAHECARLL